MSKNLTRGLLSKLKGKMAGNLDEGQLRTLASTVNKDDLQDENKARQLIKTLSTLSGVTLSQEKEDQIVHMLKENKVNPEDIQSLSKLLK